MAEWGFFVEKTSAFFFFFFCLETEKTSGPWSIVLRLNGWLHSATRRGKFRLCHNRRRLRGVGKSRFFVLLKIWDPLLEFWRRRTSCGFDLHTYDFIPVIIIPRERNIYSSLCRACRRTT